MTITDACACGAKFSARDTVYLSQVKAAHVRWLESHSPCRTRESTRPRPETRRVGGYPLDHDIDRRTPFFCVEPRSECPTCGRDVCVMSNGNLRAHYCHRTDSS